MIKVSFFFFNNFKTFIAFLITDADNALLPVFEYFEIYFSKSDPCNLLLMCTSWAITISKITISSIIPIMPIIVRVKYVEVV